MQKRRISLPPKIRNLLIILAITIVIWVLAYLNINVWDVVGQGNGTLGLAITATVALVGLVFAVIDR
jgi:polyferredoxin